MKANLVADGSQREASFLRLGERFASRLLRRVLFPLEPRLSGSNRLARFPLVVRHALDPNRPAEMRQK
ncbi:MAG: hypothetical protein ACM3N0_09105 [Chloroflexota bacterium]